MDADTIEAEYDKAQKYYDHHVANLQGQTDLYNSLTLVARAAWDLHLECWNRLLYSNTKNAELRSDERIARGSYERAERERLRAEGSEAAARAIVDEAGALLSYWTCEHDDLLFRQQPRTPGGGHYSAQGYGYPAPEQGGGSGGYRASHGPASPTPGQGSGNAYYSARKKAENTYRTPEKGSRNQESPPTPRAKGKQREGRHSRPAEQPRHERDSGRKSDHHGRTPQGKGRGPKRDSYRSERTPRREEERAREPPRSARRDRSEPQPRPQPQRRPSARQETKSESDAESESESSSDVGSPPPPRRPDPETQSRRSASVPPPPRDPRSAARPKAQIIQKWFDTVDQQFSNYVKVETFPVPPSWRCGNPACVVGRRQRHLDACTCNLKYLFEGRQDFKSDRKKWHPDKFSRCKPELRDEFKAIAGEVVHVFALIEDDRKTPREKAREHAEFTARDGR